MDEEVEYGRVYKSRKGPNAIGAATTSAASTAKATMIPSASPAKKTVKNIVLVLYTPRPNDWGSWQIRCHMLQVLLQALMQYTSK